MSNVITAGIDVGSTYTKVALVDESGRILSRHLAQTGFKLALVSRRTFETCLAEASLSRDDVGYVVATGVGRHLVDFKDVHVTEITSTARGAAKLFPNTRTVLDVGGQTMKASRLDERAKVVSFRLNDKCAAGTGAFLEKTARYMGYTTTEIGPLLATSKQPVTISGVCAVFAESEVINHLSQGTPPADIMHGSLVSLVERSVQLLRRVKAEPEYTLVGGILQFESMVKMVQDELKCAVNVPEGDLTQYVAALGAALLGHQRLSASTAASSVRATLL
jgi:(R)-2-hydroxyacyl-CoA dehydratese activating ATPase